MKKIARRAVVCGILALLLAAGLAVFLVKYLLSGGDWASSPFNRHLYDTSGQLVVGSVLDRDGDVLSAGENGKRTYYTTRRSARPRSTLWATFRATLAPGR